MTSSVQKSIHEAYRKFKIIGNERWEGVSSEAARQVGFFFDEERFRWIETNKFRPWQKEDALMRGLIASVWLLRRMNRRTGKPNPRIPCSWKPRRNNDRSPKFLASDAANPQDRVVCQDPRTLGFSSRQRQKPERCAILSRNVSRYRPCKWKNVNWPNCLYGSRGPSATTERTFCIPVPRKRDSRLRVHLRNADASWNPVARLYSSRL